MSKECDKVIRGLDFPQCQVKFDPGPLLAGVTGRTLELPWQVSIMSCPNSRRIGGMFYLFSLSSGGLFYQKFFSWL